MKKLLSKAKAETEKKMPPVKKVGGLPWLLWLGIIMGSLSLALVTIYFINPELMFLGYFSVILLGISCLVTWSGWKKRGGGGVLLGEAATGPAVAKQQGKFNTVTIYHDLVCFEYVEDVSRYGQPRKCRNDGQYYYVRIEDADNYGHFNPVVLPDSYEYYDPKEYSNLLQLPAWRRYNERESNLWEKLSPGFLVISQGALIIALIALNGPGG